MYNEVMDIDATGDDDDVLAQPDTSDEDIRLRGHAAIFDGEPTSDDEVHDRKSDDEKGQDAGSSSEELANENEEEGEDMSSSEDTAACPL